MGAVRHPQGVFRWWHDSQLAEMFLSNVSMILRWTLFLTVRMILQEKWFLDWKSQKPVSEMSKCCGFCTPSVCFNFRLGLKCDLFCDGIMWLCGNMFECIIKMGHMSDLKSWFGLLIESYYFDKKHCSLLRCILGMFEYFRTILSLKEITD